MTGDLLETESVLRSLAESRADSAESAHQSARKRISDLESELEKRNEAVAPIIHVNVPPTPVSQTDNTQLIAAIMGMCDVKSAISELASKVNALVQQENSKPADEAGPVADPEVEPTEPSIFNQPEAETAAEGVNDIDIDLPMFEAVRNGMDGRISAFKPTNGNLPTFDLVRGYDGRVVAFKPRT